MQVTIDSVTYECRAAYKGQNYVRLYLGTYGEDGVEDIATFAGIDIRYVSVEGGEWEASVPTIEDRLEATEDLLLSILGVI